MYLCVHFNAVLDVHFYDTRSNVNGNLYVPNVKRGAFKQSMLYIWLLQHEQFAFLFKKVLIV